MDEGGFDVIIGNPPYINAIQLKKSLNEEVRLHWKDKYTSAKGTYDIYILFFEQSLKLCKEGGFVCFITPNKYLSSPYGKALRELIANNYKLIKVLDLSRVKVFDNPSVYPIITIIQKTKQKKEYNICSEKIFSSNLEDKETYNVSSNNLKCLPDNLWGIILSENSRIIEKIFDKSELLKDVATVQATSTAAEADEYSRFISDDGTGISLINTGTIDRYNTTYGSVRFMNKGERLFKPKLDLQKVSDTRKSLYQNSKIIIAKLALRIEGFLDKKGDYASINTNCIHSPKGELTLDYLVGIMNSNLLSFVYSELFSGLRMSGGYFQFQSPQLRTLPIATPSQKELTEMSLLVQEIIRLNERVNKLNNKKTDEALELESKIEKTDKKIDELVYKIYGLNLDEVEIIEKTLN